MNIAQVRSLMVDHMKFFGQKTQIIFLLVFLIGNGIFFLNAELVSDNGEMLHPTYAGAPDGQRYWGVARNLVERGSFEYEHQSGSYSQLVRGGPLPALVLAVPIKLVGFENAPILIVVFQCLLLYGMGLLSRRLVDPLPIKVNKNLLQGLIVFNPNLIGIAHHAQSDLFFAFLFTLLFVPVSVLLWKQPIQSRLILWIGLVAGLLPLTRIAGFIFILLLPMVLFFAIWLAQPVEVRRSWIPLLRSTLIAAVISVVVMTPWAIRNEIVLGNPHIAQGKIQILSDNYLLLLHSNGRTNENIRANVENYARNNNLEACCVANYRTPYLRKHCDKDNRIYSCDDKLTNIHLSLILQEPLSVLTKGLILSWVNTYIAGGATAITSYIGISQLDKRKYLYESDGGWIAYRNYVIKAFKENSIFFFVMAITTGFSVIARFFGLVGLCLALIRKDLAGQNLFFLLVVGILTATSLFIGMSRFRAPLEPILMLYAAVGFGGTVDLLKRLFTPSVS